MKLYLSSYEIGSEVAFLKSHISECGNKIGYIPNARNYTLTDPDKYQSKTAKDLKDLEEIGFDVSVLDLRDYFNKSDKLKEILNTVNSVWVSGGNTFILRQAMQISGFDNILIEELFKREDFLYAGYSAGCCVLSPDLSYLQIVDNPTDFPYEEITETIWEGLEIIDFAFLPHYDSNHPESADIDKEIKYCIDNKILFLALRDGEVIIEK